MSYKCKLIVLVATLYCNFNSYADLIADRDLSFGRIAVISNDVVSTVQMSRSGRATATNNIYILEIGQPGVYTLTDLPPYVVISLSADIPAYSSSPIPGTEQFSISAVDMPGTIKANAAGIAQFRVGGVLQTSGAGGTYVSPATYQIMLPINISY